MPGTGALVYPIYMPAMREIADITNALEAVVTTTFAHGYITGSICRFYIPLYFGMQQVNRHKGSITVLSPTTFSITVDTTLMDPFSIPPLQPGSIWTPAQIVPIGEDTDTFDSAFINILTPLF